MKFSVLAGALAALALSAGAFWWAQPHQAEAAVDNLYTTQSCMADGKVSVTFSWDGGSQYIVQQWLDLSLQDNHWQPETFLGNGPLAAAQQKVTWQGLLPNLTHYVRVNQWYRGSTVGAGPDWQASPTFYFTTASCSPTTGVMPPPTQGSGSGSGSSFPPPDPDRKRVDAPIETATVGSGSVSGAFVAKVKAGLPGGCAKQGGYEVMKQAATSR